MITDEIRNKWKNQLIYIWPYKAHLLDKYEFAFIKSIISFHITLGHDLDENHSKRLNNIYEKYK